LDTVGYQPKVCVVKVLKFKEINQVKPVTLLFCTFLAVLSWPKYASAEVRIGYLDVTRVAEESPQYQAARRALQGELQRREGDLRRMAEQLKAQEDTLRRNATVMSDDAAKRTERQIIALRRKLQNSRGEYRDELSLRQNEERTKLLRQVAEVRAIGKEGNFDLILTEGVAYADKRIDISDQVLLRLKKGFRSR
jgi:outer membrane protein